MLAYIKNFGYIICEMSNLATAPTIEELSLSLNEKANKLKELGFKVHTKVTARTRRCYGYLVFKDEINYCCNINFFDHKIIWYQTNQKDVNLEEVLNNCTKELRECILFNLDLFV